MYSVLWHFLFAGLGLLVAASPPVWGQVPQGSEPSPRPESVKVATIPVSLKAMVGQADRIFIGEVRDVTTEPQEVPGVGKKVAIRTVTFKIQQVLKDNTGKLKVGESYQVRQLPEVSREVKKGETLLWYLAPTHPETGLTQPVGVDSGHFRLVGEGKRAINLKGNKDLLDVSDMKKERAAVLDFVDGKKHAQVDEEIGRLKAAQFAKPGHDISLDLLVGRTKMLAADGKK
jgi:hypothetical protein